MPEFGGVFGMSRPIIDGKREADTLACRFADY